MWMGESCGCGWVSRDCGWGVEGVVWVEVWVGE